ncbi:MAG: hypothetical protein ABL857_01295 [Rickettsiales bacterium]|jgi:hypothetical protein
MENNSELCTNFIKCLFDFQTLVAGIFAIIAAVFSARVILKAAKLPIEAQNINTLKLDERKKLYTKQILAESFRLLSSRTMQAEGTINVHIGSNVKVTEQTREKTILRFHKIIDEWEFVSLLPSDIFNEIMSLRRSIEDHNFDMERARGVFGDDNFKRIILSRTKSIQQQASQIANKLSKDT